MPLSFHNGLQSDDCAAIIEKSTCSESVDKSSYRTSVFVEHPDLPPVWGKDSQPGYKGKRVLGLLPKLYPEGPYANSGLLGAYDPKYTEPARMVRPLDIGYEMLERYRGKEVAWNKEGATLLAGNNNSWAPPVVQERRVCGVARWAFWTVLGCICFLIIGGVVGGVISAITSSKKNASRYEFFNQLIDPQQWECDLDHSGLHQCTYCCPTLNNDNESQPASTTEGSSVTISFATSTSTSAVAVSIHSLTSVTTRPSSEIVTSAATSGSSASIQSPSAQVYPLNCPAINGEIVSTTAGTTSPSYTVSCNTDLTSPIVNTVTATSLLECFNACAQYTNLQSTTCRAATFNANQATGNCYLRSDASSIFSTGSDNSIAVAVLQS